MIASYGLFKFINVTYGPNLLKDTCILVICSLVKYISAK